MEAIFADTPEVNWRICFLMYLMKESLRQRPMSMMVMMGTPDRYIAMAPPERMEWVPMSLALKPRASSPMLSTAQRSILRTWSRVRMASVPASLMKAQTGVSGVKDGIFAVVATTAAQRLTGQRMGWSEAC